MKKQISFPVVFFVATFALSQPSFAEENVGAVKGAWRNILNTLKKTGAAETPELPHPVTPRASSGPKIHLGSEEKASLKSPSDSPARAEIIERIKYMLEITPEAAYAIPELELGVDREGNVTGIKYSVDGMFKDIDLLDKDTLGQIHSRVANERTRIQSERIQSQLEAARAAQTAPVAPPRVHTAPAALPKVPTLPPQQPKVPMLPQRAPGSITPPPAPPAPPPAPPPLPPRPAR